MRSQGTKPKRNKWNIYTQDELNYEFFNSQSNSVPSNSNSNLPRFVESKPSGFPKGNFSYGRLQNVVPQNKNKKFSKSRYTPTKNKKPTELNLAPESLIPKQSLLGVGIFDQKDNEPTLIELLKKLNASNPGPHWKNV